jgi:hypothetical protein
MSYLQVQPYRAAKKGGSYQADGTVLVEFLTTTGQRRCVFEFDQPRGMVRIFNPEQLTEI